MLNFVRHSIYKILFGKEGETMMAMLWAQKIMYAETKEMDDNTVIKRRLRIKQQY